MASVRHPNVISYLGICTEPACIVTEYCAKGSLTDVGSPFTAVLAVVGILHLLCICQPLPVQADS